MMGLFLHPSSSWKTISSLSRRSLHQIHELVKEGGKRLEGKVPSPFLESEILLSHSLGIPRNQLFGPSSKDLMNNSIGFLEHFEECLERRERREPIAYITSHKEFYNLDFEVSDQVLIPRPETELLVDTALSIIKKRKHSSTSILELGVGSGCVLSSILFNSQSTVGFGVDISENALQLAQKNAESIFGTKSVCYLNPNVPEDKRESISPNARMCLMKSNWMSSPLFSSKNTLSPEKSPSPGECNLIQKFFPIDILVSNPPYLSKSEITEQFQSYEPRLALDGGQDGLDAYRQIGQDVCRARDSFSSSAVVLLEIGLGQEETGAKAFIRETKNSYELSDVLCDLQSHPRILVLNRVF